MKRFPVLPTLLVFVLTAALVGLGGWQLQRAQWKRQLIVAAEMAPQLPVLTPDELVAAASGRTYVQYRRAELVCRPGRVRPYDLKGGSSAGGQTGYLVLVSCLEDQALVPDIVAVAGWTRRPDAAALALVVDTVFAGLIIEQPYGDVAGRPKLMLIPDTAVAPLAPSRLPVAGDLPDNHLAYAGQWFGLALALLAIYGLWLRRRAVALGHAGG